jgi:hypothetical protein
MRLTVAAAYSCMVRVDYMKGFIEEDGILVDNYGFTMRMCSILNLLFFRMGVPPTILNQVG